MPEQIYLNNIVKGGSNTEADWSVDVTVRPLGFVYFSSDAFYLFGNGNQLKFKISDGANVWADLDYMQVDTPMPTLGQVMAAGAIMFGDMFDSSGYGQLHLGATDASLWANHPIFGYAGVQLSSGNNAGIGFNNVVGDIGGGFYANSSGVSVGLNYFTYNGVINILPYTGTIHEDTVKIEFNTPIFRVTNATASTIAAFDASKNLVSLPLATYPSWLELSYVKGVTSPIQPQLTALSGGLGAHLADTANPHNTTLEQARTADNFVSGEIDMNGNAVRNLPTATNADEAVSLGQVAAMVDNTLKAAEYYDPTITGNYPLTYGGNAIEAGDTFRLGAGTINGIAVAGEELLIALVDAPGATTDADWQILESNRVQATESVKGIAEIATQVEVENELSSNNTDIVTPQKFWFGLLRFLQLAWTWDLKQTFTTAPRFSSANASEYLKTNGTKDLTTVSSIPSTDITGTKTSSYISDFVATVLATVLTGLSLATSTAITAADSILIALGKLQAQITTNWGILSAHLADVGNPHSVTKSQVGLGNVDNVNATRDSFIFMFDGDGSVATPGAGSYKTPGFAGTITDIEMYEDTGNPCTAVVDLWRDTYANFPPTVGDTVFGTKPQLTAGVKSQLSGLSITFTASQGFKPNLDSNDLGRKIIVVAYFNRT